MTGQPTAAASSSWADLFRDGRGIYTVLLNLGVSLHAMNIFVIATVMPSVVRDLGGASLYAWPSMLYMLGTIVGAASGAAVRAALGRRQGYAAAALIFAAGAAGCGAAPTMAFLIGAHFIQGLGGGLVISQSMALVRELYDDTLRTRALATVSSTWSIAALLGPLLGGAFGDLGWWRGAFWVLVPVTLVFVAMAWRAIPEIESQRGRVRLPYRRLALLAIGVLCVGFTGQIESLFYRAPLFAVSIAAVWMAIRLDGRSPQAMFPSRVFSLFSAVGTAYWLNFTVGISHLAMTLFMPLSLQVLHGVSPIWAGLMNTVMSFTWTVGSVMVGGWSGAGHRHAMVLGMMIAAASNLALALWIGTTSIWVITAISALMGIGIGMANVHVNAYTMAIAEPGEETITAAAMPAVRSLGIAFGAATLGFVANAAGLGQGLSPVIVEGAVFWLFGANALIPVISVLLAIRMTALRDRRLITH